MMKPGFPGVRAPSIDFQAVRDGRRSRPLYFVVNLDTARSIANGITDDITDVSGKALRINSAGNAWWADPIYDSAGNYIAGIAVAHFEDSALGSGISTPITILPNSAHRVPFTSVILENFAQVGKKLRVVFGVDIDFVPGFNAQSTIAGTVAVQTTSAAAEASLRFGDQVSAAGQAFEGGSTAGPVAAQLSQVQLWNPTAGNVVYVDAIDVAMLSATDRFNVRLHNAAIVTDIASAANLDNAGAASNARIRAGANGASFGTIIKPTAQLVNVRGELRYDPPIRLQQNEGVHVEAFTVNTSIVVSFRFREKAT